MTTPNDNSYIMQELRELRVAQQKTQLDIVEKLAKIQADLAHYPDIRMRLEALEKINAKRAGSLAVIAAVAATVSAIVVSIMSRWASALLSIV